MMNKYMGTYIDRRMEALIDEWHLATKRDIDDFVTRIDALADEIARLTEAGNRVSERLSLLEARALGAMKR
jgi:polyhydroxyalkanoate synthesis regulator phasin